MGNTGVVPVSGAANDMRFYAQALSLQDTEEQTTLLFSKSYQTKYFFKPTVIHFHTVEVLPYPSHYEFRKRISYDAWKKFNADFSLELYNAAPTCLAIQLCLVIPLIITAAPCAETNDSINALFKVIAYYNEVLFRPMMIEAQVFVQRFNRRGPINENVGNTDESCGCTTARSFHVSFLVAQTADEFFKFPRPVAEHSTGYRQISGPPFTGICIPFINFHLDKAGAVTVLPLGSPAPTFATLHEHSEEYLALDPVPVHAHMCWTEVNETLLQGRKPEGAPITQEHEVGSEKETATVTAQSSWSSQTPTMEECQEKVQGEEKERLPIVCSNKPRSGRRRSSKHTPRVAGIAAGPEGIAQAMER